MPSVLVTGAGRGFGRAVGEVFHERGLTVFPLVRSRQAAADWAALDPARCHPICADVTLEDAEAEIGQVLAAHGGTLDLLVNNAGSIRKRRWLPETATEDVEEAVRVHCIGALRCTRAALPFLRGSRAPTIVNVSSRFGSIAGAQAGDFRGIYSYSIAKGAQNMLSVCLDHELRPEGIRVFAVHPGRLMTAAAASDADTEPRVAAGKLADWVQSVDRDAPCGLWDLMADRLLPW